MFWGAFCALPEPQFFDFLFKFRFIPSILPCLISAIIQMKWFEFDCITQQLGYGLIQLNTGALIVINNLWNRKCIHMWIVFFWHVLSIFPLILCSFFTWKFSHFGGSIHFSQCFLANLPTNLFFWSIMKNKAMSKYKSILSLAML